MQLTVKDMMFGPARKFFCQLVLTASATTLIPLSLLLPQSVQAQSDSNEKGTLFAFLIQVSDYKGQLKLAPSSLSRSIPVMKEAIEKFAQNAGYDHDSVKICEIIKPMESEKPSSGDGNYTGVGGDRPQFCQVKQDGKLVEPRTKHDDILSVLKSFMKEPSNPDKDMLIFYFTGHGNTTKDDVALHLSESDGINAPPVLTLKEILGVLLPKDNTNTVVAKRVLLFLDTCQTREISMQNFVLGTKQEARAQKVAMFFSSSTADNQASYIDPRHRMGYFTRILALALEGDAVGNYDVGRDRNDLSLYAEDIKIYLRKQLPAVMELDVKSGILKINKPKPGKEPQMPDAVIPPSDPIIDNSYFALYSRKIDDPSSISLALGADDSLQYQLEILQDTLSSEPSIPSKKRLQIIGSEADENTPILQFADLNICPRESSTASIAAESERLRQIRTSATGEVIVLGYLRNPSTARRGIQEKQEELIFYSCIFSKTTRQYRRLRDLITPIHSSIPPRAEESPLSRIILDHLNSEGVPIRSNPNRIIPLFRTAKSSHRSEKWDTDSETKICMKFPKLLKKHIASTPLPLHGVEIMNLRKLATQTCEGGNPTKKEQEIFYRELSKHQGALIINGTLQLHNFKVEATELEIFRIDTDRPTSVWKSAVGEFINEDPEAMNDQSVLNWEARHLARHLANRFASEYASKRDSWLQPTKIN